MHVIRNSVTTHKTSRDERRRGSKENVSNDATDRATDKSDRQRNNAAPAPDHASSTRKLMPLPAPEDRMQRLVLFAVRRMAAHGVRDAYAANLLFSNFGINFRRPLVLLRAFMIELSQASKRTITIAPCCALRMTEDEGRIIGVLASVTHNRTVAAGSLCELTGDNAISSPLSVAAAFNSALADLGRPLVV